ncbi:MAG: ABC transporter permease, partial [Bifidobacterium crudilactis]|nr:ABC transporter permease [Bifidobacterium crudilactis]
VIFFFVFLISGIGLLHERTTGTLNRLLATPIRKREIIFGYLVGYGIVAIVQTAVVVGYTLVVFKTQILGSLWNVVLLNLMIAGAALTLGLLVSSFAATEFQMMQFIPIIVIPQIFFSGIIPVESMPGWLQAVAHAMPLYWGSRGMSDVVVKGASLAQIAPNLGVLLAFILVFLGLNLVVMRKYRRV